MVSIISALTNIVNQKNASVQSEVKSHTLANALGDSLEIYVRDAFANTFGLEKEQKNDEYEKIFSWLGNQNNPPDLIIKDSDAIEVKKTESINALALNSSYPKANISYDSSRVTRACTLCEGPTNKWKKDIIYACGVVNKKVLVSMFFVYGDIYSADESVYTKIHSVLKTGIEAIGDVEFSRTTELGKVKKVDPLGITSLRMRGLWSIDHPLKVYNYLDQVTPEKDMATTLYCLIPERKFSCYDQDELNQFEKLPEVQKYSVKVKNPNNPVQLISSVLYKIHI